MTGCGSDGGRPSGGEGGGGDVHVSWIPAKILNHVLGLLGGELRLVELLGVLCPDLLARRSLGVKAEHEKDLGVGILLGANHGGHYGGV